MKNRQAQGFTQVDLLVLIAILVTLANLVVSAIGDAEAASTRSVCQDNQRSWGSAIHRFALNHDYALPHNTGQNLDWHGAEIKTFWKDYLLLERPDTKQPKASDPAADVLYCPTDRYTRKWDANPWDVDQVSTPSYLYLAGQPSESSVTYFGVESWLTRVALETVDPSVPLLSDALRSASARRPPIWETKDPATWRPIPTAAHTQVGEAPEGANFLYEDGSVQWRPMVDSQTQARIQKGATSSRWTYYFRIPTNERAQTRFLLPDDAPLDSAIGFTRSETSHWTDTDY